MKRDPLASVPPPDPVSCAVLIAGNFQRRINYNDTRGYFVTLLAYLLALLSLLYQVGFLHSIFYKTSWHTNRRQKCSLLLLLANCTRLQVMSNRSI